MVLSLLNLTRDTILSSLGLLQYTDLFIFEVLDMIIITLAIGYIFSDFIRKPASHDPLAQYKKTPWIENLKYAAIVAGPAVVLHELGHKFVAMLFGAKAVLYAPYGFYLFVILLKAIGFPLLFFVGGFVAHSPLPALPSALVAVAGPAVNLLIYLGIRIGISKKLIKRKYLDIAVPMAKINIFLAIFNMIPFPGFDGYSFFKGLFGLFF